MCFIEGFCSFPPALAWRRPWTFVYIAIGFSFLNILLLILLNYDERLTQEAKSYKSIGNSSETCNLLDDPLAISALSRMKSPECKFMLRQLLCSMEAKKHWPVTEVNNTCEEYFDPTIRQQKLGCFKDPVSDRLLQDFRYNFSISNSPELCVQNCLHAGFALAGVEFGVECFCASSSLSGQDLAERSIADSLCEEYKCPGNGNAFCANGASFLSSHGYNTGSFLHKQGFHYHFAECERRMWRVARRDNFPRNLRLDGGSDWVVVHRDLAQFAISRAPLPSQLRLLFQSILLPLESFFHTLALNSDQFCRRVLYRNLRFTNWRRKQGCRCSALKPVVDWCGCSPLALRGHEVEAKLQNFHLKSQFFGRKFDSMVDQAPIAFVEQGRVLRFRPERIPDRQHPAFNATWLNLFHATATGGAANEEEDSDSPFVHKVDLLQAIARALLTSEGANEENSIAGQFLHSFGANCRVQRLLDVHVYKADLSNARAQTLLSVEMECRQQQLVQIELLLDFVHDQRKLGEEEDEAIGVSNHFQFDGNRGIEFGLGFDVKEEIFRVHPPILDTASPGQTFTLKWHWNILAEEMTDDSMMAANKRESANGTKTMGKSSSNNYNKLTSPAVELELRGPNVGNGEELPPLLLLNIDAYDSVWGNQHVQIRLDELGEEEAILAGIWTAALFLPANSGAPRRQRIKIAETSFPIFPSLRPTPFAPSPPNPSSSSSGSGISAAAADAVGRIARRHFSLRDICVVLSSDDDGEAEEEITMMMTDYGLKECIETVWSSGFGADEKSEFPFPNFVQ